MGNAIAGMKSQPRIVIHSLGQEIESLADRAPQWTRPALRRPRSENVQWIMDTGSGHDIVIAEFRKYDPKIRSRVG